MTLIKMCLVIVLLVSTECIADDMLQNLIPELPSIDELFSEDKEVPDVHEQTEVIDEKLQRIEQLNEMMRVMQTNQELEEVPH